MEHWDKILEGGGLLFFVMCAVIAVTPTKKDDTAFLGFLRTPLARKLATGGSLATAGALAAALLSGCAGRVAVPVETARASDCIAAETACVNRGDRGDISVAEMEACVSYTRSTCDVLREHLLSGDTSGDDTGGE
jgi:hypothetical protein